MMSGVFTIFIFVAVIVLTAVIFFGWVAFAVLRFVFGGVTQLFAPSQHRPVRAKVANTVQCSLRMCGAVNPVQAKFCRRCGRGLPAAQRVQVRRAAVW